MSKEDLRFANMIREALDQGSTRLDRSVLDRLHRSRQEALARQKVEVAGLSFAGLGHFATSRLPFYARTAVAAFALSAGVVFTYYWNTLELAAENAEVDSALLSDELPPAAYLDKGFQTWLERSSQSSPQ